MLSINQKKYVNSLKQKKYRNQFSSFIVEGEKMIEELIKSDYTIEVIYGTEEISVPNFFLVSEKELASISSLSSPNKFLAVVKQKSNEFVENSNSLILALDKIKDPGNMGTIIRIADWFGIDQLVCSLDCVDVYNSKVIQATMGSIFRVKLKYEDLANFFQKNSNKEVYGALLDGENLYKTSIKPKNAVLLMGNESQGISKELIPFITKRITIPKFGNAESLNVAVATAILCSESRRD
ncbi:MAG: RNA methyltransferase [Flavobacteriales bacterium]|nr:RNA methyltransferase [Flavobacteriales bacterium]MCB9334700.1 RNA methyltransferase [Flavobacteriales bacterium]